MNKQLITLVFLLLTGMTFSQKGSWYIGGSLGFSTNTKNVAGSIVQKSNSWTVSPEVGTFLTSRIQLGIAATTKGYFTENPSISNSRGLTYGGAVYSRYFFGENAFKPFVGVNLTALTGSNSTKNLISNTSNRSTVLALGANLNCGFGYSIAPRFNVVGSFGLFGYTSLTTYPSTGSKTVDSGFSLDLSSLGNRFTVGFYYTFKEAKGE